MEGSGDKEEEDETSCCRRTGAGRADTLVLKPRAKSATAKRRETGEKDLYIIYFYFHCKSVQHLTLAAKRKEAHARGGHNGGGGRGGESEHAEPCCVRYER
jgi:hypothetical protein